jgi:hypothetical protein
MFIPLSKIQSVTNFPISHPKNPKKLVEVRYRVLDLITQPILRDNNDTKRTILIENRAEPIRTFLTQTPSIDQWNSSAAD